MTGVREAAVAFDCEGDTLVGVVADRAGSGNNTGVVIIVGGPQYRAGSHRQFVQLARRFASEGMPVLRFDYRGMGDATGRTRSFDEITSDIASAIRALRQACPTVERVVLWGLCDAASAALLYWDDTRDDSVAGLVLVNPWVRSTATIARTELKHYYRERLLQREFWAKLAGGGVDVVGAVSGVARRVMSARSTSSKRADETRSFRDRMASGLGSFAGPVLLLLSERDLTAKEFLEYAATQPDWEGLLAQTNVERVDLPQADHTFSSAEQRRRVEDHTLDWLARRLGERPR